MRYKAAWVGGSLAVLAGVVFVFASGWFDLLQTSHDLSQARADAQASGLVLDPATITSILACRPEENAALALKPVLEEIRSDPFLGQSKSDTERLKLLRGHPGLVDRALAALKKPRLDFGRDWSKGVNVQFPELAQEKTLGKCLVVSMMEASRVGDLTRFKALSAGMSELTHLSAQDPSLIPSLVSLALHALHVDAVYRAIGLHRSDPNWTAVGRSVRLDTSKVNAAHANRFEAGLMLPHLAKGDSLSLDSISTNTMAPELQKHPLPTGPGARDAMIVWMLRDYTKLVGGSKSAGDDPEAQIRFVRAFKEELERDHHAARNLSRFVIDPDCILLFGTTTMKDEMVRLSSLLFDFEHEKGSFPEKLPWKNRMNFVYSKTKSGFKLYSVLHNGPTKSVPSRLGLSKSPGSRDWGVWFEPDDPRLRGPVEPQSGSDKQRRN